MPLPSEYIKHLPRTEVLPSNSDKFAAELSGINSNLRELSDKFSKTLAALSALTEAQSKIVLGLGSTPMWVPELKSSVDKLSSTMVAIVRPKNPDTIEVHQLILTAALTGQQFPVLLMPWDHSVVIKALAANAGTIYIAGNKADAENTAASYPLAAGETIEYKINDLSALWASASVANEGLIWTTEAQVG